MNRSAIVASVMAASVCLTACSQPQSSERPIPPPLPCPTLQPTPFGAFTILGGTTHVVFGGVPACWGGIKENLYPPEPTPTSVTVEVTDPSNLPVPFAASPPLDDGVLVDVAFTPDRPGTWHLTAKFEPSIGTVHRNLEVAEWRADAGFRTAPWQRSGTCTHYDVTASGTLLCFQPAPETSLEEVVVTALQTFSAGGYALEGDALWRLNPVEGRGFVLERWVEDGGVFVPTHRREEPLVAVGALSARGGDVWMWATRTNDLALIHLHPEDDGGLSSDERVVPGATSVGVPYFVDGLAVNSSGLMVTDEGALVTTARAIAILSPDGGMESLPFDGPFAGSDSDALWLSRRDNYSPITTLSAIGWTDAGVREATLPLPSGPLGDYRTFVSPSNTVVGSFPPILRGAIVPRFEAGHIALEAYDPGEGYAPVSSATRRHAFARSLDGGAVKIFDR